MQDWVREPIEILLVDDDPEFLDVARETLEREAGLSVRTAAGTAAGLAALEEADVDCVVSDYRMPEMDGLEFLDAVHEVRPGIPFVLFTGRGSEEVASEAITAGVDDYVLKTGTPDPYRVLANRVRNVVEQHRAETSYREVFDRASIGMTVYDPETGELVAANPHYYEMLGHDPETAGTLSLEDVTAGEEPYTAERAREVIEETVEAGGQTVEWLYRRADGDRIWVELSLRPARLGGRDRLLGAVRDVTERTEREHLTDQLQRVTRDLMTAETDEAVARIAARAAADLVDLSHSGVYLLEDRVLAGTAIAAGDERLPRLAAFVGGEDATPVDDLVWTAFEDGRQAVYHRDDGAVPASSSIETLCVYPLGEHGAFVGASEHPDAVDAVEQSLLDILTANVTAALDRAEREAALRERETELARQNERLEEFAGIVSHDLRDPLEAAYGHLELASTECETEHHDGLREMLTRMEDIVKDALTLARHGQAVVEPEPVDLGEVVDAAWSTAGSGTATLRTQGRLGTIRGDRTRITGLLENLFRNAVEHAGEDATVTIGGFDDGFYVEDDGPGIPKEDRDRVFEAGHSTGEDSAGLGLAIVEQIAEAHGWAVSVVGGADGGARFEVTGVERP